MQQVTLDEAKEKLGDLIEAASRGEEVVISGGAQVVRIVLHQAESDEPKKARRAGSLEGLLIVPPDFNEPMEHFKEYLSRNTYEVLARHARVAQSGFVGGQGGTA